MTTYTKFAVKGAATVFGIFQNESDNMEIPKTRVFTRRNLLIILFVVFLFLRLFTSDSYIFIGGDYIKYLEMAKHFPYSTTLNNQLEITHGPFFPYVIYFTTLIFQEDYIASLFISIVSACVTFFILYRLFMMLTNNFYVTFTTLILFTLSVEFVIASKTGLKESFLVMLLVLTIYYYIKGIKFNKKSSIIASSVFGGLTAITADHAIFLFPVFVLSYIFFKKISIKTFNFPNLKYALLPVVVTLLFYASWTGVKAYQYSTNEYYPAGAVGAPISTKDFGISQLINPRHFEDYDSRLPSGFTIRARDYAFGLGYMFNIVPFDVPRGLNLVSMNYLLFPKHVVYMVLIYLPLSLIALFTILLILKNFIKTRRVYNNINLYLLGVFLIFIFPLTQKVSSTRFIYTAYIFLFYFISLGLVTLFTKFRKVKIYTGLITLVIIMVLLLIPYWYYYNSNFVFFNEKFIYKGQNTADFINSNLNENDALMIQAGYIYKLQYLTNRRTVGLPSTSENLLYFIDYYNIDYVVFGRYFTWGYYYYSKEAVEYIMTHPEEFEAVATIQEEGNLKRGIKPDEIYIYKVIR